MCEYFRTAIICARRNPQRYFALRGVSLFDEFEWHVACEGHDWIEHPAESGRTLLTRRAADVLIRPRDGERRSYRPFNAGRGPALWRRFAELWGRDRSALAEFVDAYGLLFRDDKPQLLSAYRARMREFWIFTEIIAAFGLKDAAPMLDRVKPRLQAFSDPLGDPPVALTLMPVDLYNAMLLQLVEEVAGRPDWRLCPACGTPFRLGKSAATKRRVWCSPGCRVKAYRRAKRTAAVPNQLS